MSEAGDEHRRLAADVPCRACDYNLRTLAVTGTCPECGYDIGASIAFYRENPPRSGWVRQVESGLGMVLVSLELGLMLPVLGRALAVGGVFLATQPEPGRESGAARRRVRWALAVWVGTGAAALTAWQMAALGRPPVLFVLAALIDRAVAAVGAFLLLAYLQTLALRMGKRRHARRLRLAGWGVLVLQWTMIAVMGPSWQDGSLPIQVVGLLLPPRLIPDSGSIHLGWTQGVLAVGWAWAWVEVALAQYRLVRRPLAPPDEFDA